MLEKNGLIVFLHPFMKKHVIFNIHHVQVMKTSKHIAPSRTPGSSGLEGKRCSRFITGKSHVGKRKVEETRNGTTCSSFYSW